MQLPEPWPAPAFNPENQIGLISDAEANDAKQYITSRSAYNWAEGQASREAQRPKTTSKAPEKEKKSLKGGLEFVNGRI